MDDGRIPHGEDDACPGMWRLVGAELTLADGSTTTYECELCGHYLVVPPGGRHPKEA